MPSLMYRIVTKIKRKGNKRRKTTSLKLKNSEHKLKNSRLDKREWISLQATEYRYAEILERLELISQSLLDTETTPKDPKEPRNQHLNRQLWNFRKTLANFLKPFGYINNTKGSKKT